MNFRRHNYTLVTILVILILGVFASPFFFGKASSIGLFFSNIWNLPSLASKNEDLKKQVVDLQHALEEKGIGEIAAGTGLSAHVYSMHPFNTKNRLYVAEGSDGGVKKNQPVLVSQSILIGTVQSVSAHRAEILTLFDASFTLPVRIGQQEVDALLQGGISPRLTLIDKSKTVHSGDRIMTASKDMPYGLEIGTVGDVSEDASGAFFETSVQVPYNLNAVRNVRILTEYGG